MPLLPHDSYIVFIGHVSHKRETLAEATELAENLCRYGKVEIERFFWVDDPEEGIVQNSQLVYERS